MKAGTICCNQVDFIDAGGARYSYEVPVEFIENRGDNYYYKEVASCLLTATPERFYTHDPLPEWHLALPRKRASSVVCAEILSIMDTYHDQEANGRIDTPGGFEHMGDVWRTLERWEKTLRGDSATFAEFANAAKERAKKRTRHGG